MLDESIEALVQAKKDRDAYYASGKVHDANVSLATNTYQKEFLTALTSKEVLSEIVWNLKLGTARNKKKAIELRMPNTDNKYFNLVKQYTELIGPLWLEFQTFSIKRNPLLYLTYSGFCFSSDVSIEEQILFLKENGIRFDTSEAWREPKGFKRILKQLDSLYDSASS